MALKVSLSLKLSLAFQETVSDSKCDSETESNSSGHMFAETEQSWGEYAVTILLCYH